MNGDKENFYLSTRFWVFVLTPLVLLVLNWLKAYIPPLASLDPEQATTWFASIVILALTYILGRTFRNTKAR